MESFGCFIATEGGPLTGHYHVFGSLNTVLGLVDEDGYVVEAYRYDTYGAPRTVEDGGTGNPYRFASIRHILPDLHTGIRALSFVGPHAQAPYRQDTDFGDWL